MAGWPEFPEVRLLKDCPEQTVCIREVDHLAIQVWIDQVHRVFAMLSTCPEVRFMDLPAPRMDHVSP